MKHTTKPACRNPAACASDTADLRLQRDVAAVYRLGARALYELLREIGASTGARPLIDQIAARYAGLDPALVRAVGADRFPPHPDLRLVRGRHD
jgi:soluble lytic murein transglycosylase-like protein